MDDRLSSEKDKVLSAVSLPAASVLLSILLMSLLSHHLQAPTAWLFSLFTIISFKCHMVSLPQFCKYNYPVVPCNIIYRINDSLIIAIHVKSQCQKILHFSFVDRTPKISHLTGIYISANLVLDQFQWSPLLPGINIAQDFPFLLRTRMLELSVSIKEPDRCSLNTTLLELLFFEV